MQLENKRHEPSLDKWTNEKHGSNQRNRTRSLYGTPLYPARLYPTAASPIRLSDASDAGYNLESLASLNMTDQKGRIPLEFPNAQLNTASNHEAINAISSIATILYTIKTAIFAAHEVFLLQNISLYSIGVDVLFEAYFLIELLVLRRHINRYSWSNTFLSLDTGLLACSVATIITKFVALQFGLDPVEPNGVRAALLVLESICIARLYRILVLCDDAASLSKSILYSLMSLKWSALLVLGIIYGSALFATMAFSDETDEELLYLWGSLSSSMFTLFTVLTLEGWNDVARVTYDQYPHSRVFFVVYICLATLSVMNVVMGIILDSYGKVSKRLAAEPEYRVSLEKATNARCILSEALEGTRFLADVDSNTFVKIPTSDFLEKLRYRDAAGERSILEDPQLLDAEVVHIEEDKRGSNTVPWPLLPLQNESLLASDKIPNISVSVDENDMNTAERTEPETRMDNSMKDEQKRRSRWDQLAFQKYINLESAQPEDIVFDRDIHAALERAQIADYQAFEVLRQFQFFGFKSLSVPEFVSACQSITEDCSGRHLFQMQLDFTRRLRRLERYLEISVKQSEKQGRALNKVKESLVAMKQGRALNKVKESLVDMKY